jgi:hypothetical protein
MRIISVWIFLKVVITSFLLPDHKVYFIENYQQRYDGMLVRRYKATQRSQRTQTAQLRGPCVVGPESYNFFQKKCNILRN